MENPIFWIIYISLIFWSFYKKWDEKTEKYIQYPYFTTVYFLVASFAISFFFPYIFNFLPLDLFGILTLIGVVLFTFFTYWILRKINGKKISWPFFDYFQLLDVRYVIPKLSEIFFQQVFFISIFIISLNSFGGNTTLMITTIAFVLAHLNLFIFRTAREAVFYLLFSIVGAPIFILLIMNTEALWYSISVHMLFYTFLSITAWTINILKK